MNIRRPQKCISPQPKVVALNRKSEERRLNIENYEDHIGVKKGRIVSGDVEDQCSSGVVPSMHCHCASNSQ